MVQFLKLEKAAVKNKELIKRLGVEKK